MIEFLYYDGDDLLVPRAAAHPRLGPDELDSLSQKVRDSLLVLGGARLGNLRHRRFKDLPDGLLNRAKLKVPRPKLGAARYLPRQGFSLLVPCLDNLRHGLRRLPPYSLQALKRLGASLLQLCRDLLGELFGYLLQALLCGGCHPYTPRIRSDPILYSSSFGSPPPARRSQMSVNP